MSVSQQQDKHNSTGGRSGSITYKKNCKKTLILKRRITATPRKAKNTTFKDTYAQYQTKYNNTVINNKYPDDGR